MGIKGLFKHLFHYLILATTVLALSACGGGESSSSGEPRIDRQEAEATNLVFVDAQLARCVHVLIESEGYTLVEQITELTCNGQQIESQIKDIEGIENLFNLQILDLSNNLITDVAPISQLKNLKQLNLQNNQLEIAAVLTESESLEQIDLTDNDQLLCIEQGALTTKYGEGLKNPETCGSGDTTIVQAFADTELLSCVQQTVQHIKAEKEIDVLYPQQLQQLECINQNINSIAGIENLVNLRELSLSQNAIDNIGLLQGLTKLKRVLLSKNQITDIQPLISSANMQELRLDSNPLTDTGLGPIQNLRALQLLHISNTDVRDLSPLNQLTELLELRANNNRIIDLDPLSPLTKLSSLWVENNQIAKLDTIEQLPNLVHLVISNNWVTDLTPLQNSDKLRWLHLDGTEVQDLTPLSSLTELKWLQLNNTRVEDIQEIYSLTELDWLHLKGNNSIPCEQLDRMEIILTPERIERPDVESCDQTPQPQGTPISTIEFQDQELRDCVYDAAASGEDLINTDQLTSLSCSIEEYGEITDITGLEQLPELQTINLIEHNDIACTQLDDLRERYSYQGEGYEGEGYEGEYYGEVALSLPVNCNTAPSINAQAEQTVLAGEQTSITAQATDQDEDELIYSWQQTAGEEEVQLTNANTDTPSFTAPQQEQTLEFTLTVTDEHQLSTTQTISIIVTGALLGSKENPFLVETYDHLKKVGTGEDGWELDSYYLQIADIDASPSKDEDEGKGFIPIGTEEKPFTGGYDGGGFAIDGLTINRTEQEVVGLFGFVISGQLANISIENVKLFGRGYVAGIAGHLLNQSEVINISVTGEISGGDILGGIVANLVYSEIKNSKTRIAINATGNGSGGIVGQATSGVISNCISNIDIDSTNAIAGGIVGLSSYSQIIQSQSKGRINGLDESNVGGVAGLLEAGSISQSFFKGVLSAKSHVGGVAGTIKTNASIDNSYALGVVEAESFAGGLVGQSYSHENISNSYASVFVAADSFAGGLIGLNQGESPVTNSFWNTETSKLNSSDGGTPQSTEQMQTQTIYSDADWDFDSVWRINGKQYPELQWQKEPIFVASYDDLKKIGKDPEWPLDGHYIQIANINASASATDNPIDDPEGGYYGFMPIGQSVKFTGSFDGAGFAINNLYVNRGANEGLFAYSNDAYFANITMNNFVAANSGWAGWVAGLISHDINSFIDNCSINMSAVSGENVGGLMGFSEKTIVLNSSADVNIESIRSGGLITYSALGVVVNSSATGVINGGVYYAGGLVGTMHSSTIYFGSADVLISSEEITTSGGLVGISEGESMIISSHAIGDVSSRTLAGGLVGVDTNTLIERSYATGNVRSDFSGGLVGFKNVGEIHKSFATGDVSGMGEGHGIGGLVGALSSAIVTNSYAQGNVSGETGVAGLIGKMSGNAGVYNSYSVGNVTSNLEAGGLVAIIEDDAAVNNSFWDIETTGQEASAGGGTGLTTAEMQSQDTFAEWDFVDIWEMEPGSYPVLQ